MIQLQSSGSDLNDMALRVNKIMDHFLQRSFFRFRPCDRWQPAMNFYEMEVKYSISLDLAGIDPKQVELHAENNVLHVMGQRLTPAPTGGAGSSRIHVMEIDHGPFYRAISIPEDVDVTGIEAKYSQGLLWIDLPKRK